MRALISEVHRHDPTAALALRVLAGTGMRAAELLTLDLEQVRQLATRGRCTLRPGQAKGGRIRWVYATADARAACADVAVRGGPRPFACARTVTASRWRLWRTLRRAADSLGIRGRGLHGLRTYHLRGLYLSARQKGQSVQSARRLVTTRAGHRRLRATYAYTSPGPGEPAAAPPRTVPACWTGRAEDLAMVCAAAAWCAEVLQEDLVAVAGRERQWVEAAVRTGILRGQRRARSLSLRETDRLREVLARTAGMHYPFRLGCRTAAQAAAWIREHAQAAEQGLQV